MANFVIDLRKTIIEAVQSRPSIENLYITCLWITDKLKSEVEGLDTEEIFIEATKEECFQRLNEDENRPNKGEWHKLINTWFKEHGAPEKESVENTARPFKFWNFIRDETTGERTLRLDAEISSITWFDDVITPNQFREELNSGDGDIVVWINSPGGDVFAATEIYEMLRSYQGKVTVKINLAASAASIVAMAGDVVEISPLGQMFLHDPETEAFGNVGEFNAAIQMLAEIKEGIITAYETKTHLPREQISELMSAAAWLNAKKAVELGFADKIIGAENEAQDIQPARIFSQRAVTNSLSTAFRAQREAEKKKSGVKNLVKAVSKRRRLELLENELRRMKS
ncbi:MAG: Clp protease ClpP [Selenomonadaceae bacterium]|nr:Clp protease ClpP [Clostridia bacterium]MBR4381959.1 Clp protease ClpP [Selenomonadaceae bacterium]